MPSKETRMKRYADREGEVELNSYFLRLLLTSRLMDHDIPFAIVYTYSPLSGFSSSFHISQVMGERN
jgi:hypothetical protein